MLQLRARDYKITVGELPPGNRNKITDVPGITVGHRTVDTDEHKTGVTVVLPCPENPFTHKLPAAAFVLNGFGKSLGLVQVEELGTLETPIALTNTLNVGLVHDALVEYMNQVLGQRVLTGLEQERYVNLMEEVCEILFQEGPERMKSSHYEAVSLRLLDLKDYERCEKWCMRAAAQYPNTLATYSCFLKLYFSSGQREKFFETIGELKRSSVVIDRETLELIRVFSVRRQ